MRKFLNDYEWEYTLEDIKRFYAESEEFLEYDKPFEQFLEESMYYNNGSLREILTEDTPEDKRDNALVWCIIIDPDFPDDRDNIWPLDRAEIANMQRRGFQVIPRVDA